MQIGRIEGATRALGAPADWDQNRDGVCGVLPVKDVAGPPVCMVSAWYPTPEEIENIRRGAPIYLGVVGNVHPPVMLTVGEPTMPVYIKAPVAD